MAHDRKLVIGCVALTKAKVRPVKALGSAANRVRDELEQAMIQCGYLENAPFRWVGLIIRLGLTDEAKPQYSRINSNHRDLPLGIEIDVHRLLDVSEDEMARVIRSATVTALVHAGEKYKLPVYRLQTLLEQN